MTENAIRKLSIAEFHAELKAQGVGSHEDFALVCPMCGTVQSGRSLIYANAGETFDQVEKYLGFSCVGRFTKAGPPPKKRRAGFNGGCDWTLGAFFQLHRLEVVDEEGQRHPRFEVATPAQAQALAAKLITEAAHG